MGERAPAQDSAQPLRSRIARASSLLAITVVTLSAVLWLGAVALAAFGPAQALLAAPAGSGMLHAALAWTAALIAAGCALTACVLIASAPRPRACPEALVIAVAMATVALLDAAAAVASARGSGLGIALAHRPLALWTVSRTLLGATLVLGGLRITGAVAARTVLGPVGALSAVGLAAGAGVMLGAPLPELVTLGAIATRPWDLPALLLFTLAGLLVLPRMVRRRPSSLGRGLALGMVPQALGQIEAAFGGTRTLELHSVTAQLLRLVAYAGLGGVLLLELLARTRQVSTAAHAFETTRQELDRQTAELVRVDRERVVEEAMRRRAERLLRLLENAVERMSIGVVITEPDGTILYVNPAGASMHGYTPRELIGTRYDLFAPEGEPARPPASGTLDGRGWMREQISRTRDGAAFPARLVSDSVRDEDGHLLAVVTCCEDISERRRVERMKQDFIATVSHELRTPLTSIVAALGLLGQSALRDDPDRLKELTAVAHRNSLRLLHLVNDLLDLQRLSAGRLTLEMTPLEVAPLLDEAAAGMRAFAEERGVRLEVQARSGLRAVADRRRLVQVLLNLLSNAIKFSPQGAPVRLCGSREGERVVLSVQDQGPGIPPAFRDRLFERFTQADTSTTRATGGSGLGLAIARQLVEAMAGEIDFHSLDRGSTFAVRLPASGHAD